MDGGAQPHQAHGLALALPPCPPEIEENRGDWAVYPWLWTLGVTVPTSREGGRESPVSSRIYWVEPSITMEAQWAWDTAGRIPHPDLRPEEGGAGPGLGSGIPEVCTHEI